MLPRIIARMDIKGPDLIKPINLEGVRKVGNPEEFALDYYHQGIDEILYMDAVASLYDRNSLSDLVETTSREIFVPLTVGGGLRKLSDVESMLRSGADKVAINTAANKNPDIINQVSQTFGAQCMVLSIEAKKSSERPSGFEAYIDCGREKTGVDVLEWAKEAVDRGAGEILLTSVDHEGMNQGFDIPLADLVATQVPVPVILSGGMGQLEHLVEAFKEPISGAAIAHSLHYKKHSVPEMRQALRESGVESREVAQ